MRFPEQSNGRHSKRVFSDLTTKVRVPGGGGLSISDISAKKVGVFIIKTIKDAEHPETKKI